jgi:hypothetical protein
MKNNAHVILARFSCCRNGQLPGDQSIAVNSAICNMPTNQPTGCETLRLQSKVITLAPLVLHCRYSCTLLPTGDPRRQRLGRT